MSALGIFATVKFRVALVALGLVAALAAIGAAYYDGAGKVADAFADARAFAVLDRPVGDIAAATVALRGDAIALRADRSADAFKAFDDDAKSLSAKLDALAAAPHGDALAKSSDALKTQIAAIGKAYDALKQAQQTAGDSAAGGPIGKANTDAKTLLDDANAALKDKPTLEGEQMRRAAAAMARAHIQYAATLDDQAKSDFDAAAADFNAAFAAANLADDVKSTLNLDVNNYVDAFKEASSAQLGYAHAADALVKAFDPVAALATSLGDEAATAGQSGGAALAAVQGETQIRIDTAILVALAFGLVLTLLAARAGAGPLARLRDAMQRLAAGDLAVETPALGRSSADAAIERAFGAIRQAQIDDDRQAREATARREAREAAALIQRDIESERAAAAREQQQIVAALAEACERLSAGSLTFRIVENFPSTYQKLKDDFNAAMTNLNGAISVISATAGAIGDNSDAVSKIAEDLSRRTEQQASSLEETAAALTRSPRR